MDVSKDNVEFTPHDLALKLAEDILDDKQLKRYKALVVAPCNNYHFSYLDIDCSIAQTLIMYKRKDYQDILACCNIEYTIVNLFIFNYATNVFKYQRVLSFNDLTEVDRSILSYYPGYKKGMSFKKFTEASRELFGRAMAFKELPTILNTYEDELLSCFEYY